MNIHCKNVVIIYKQSYRGFDATKIISDCMHSDEKNSANHCTYIEADWLKVTDDYHDQVEQILRMSDGHYDKVYPVPNKVAVIVAEMDVLHPLMKEFVYKYLDSHLDKSFFVYETKDSSGNGFRIDCKIIDDHVVGTPI